MRKTLFAASLLLVPFLLAASGPQKIDIGQSSLTVKVWKSGLFSFLAHDHVIKASFVSGSFDEANPTVEFTTSAKDMKVADPEVSDKDRAEIQTTMLGPKVLDSTQFPEIRFQSTKAEPKGADKWLVTGNLTLHGQTRPVTVNVEKRSGRYFGTSEFKQTLFGITPVTVGGGTVKVKDEVRVEFEVVGQ